MGMFFLRFLRRRADRVRLRVVPLEAARAALFSEARLSAVFAGVFGVTALVLASIGVFGVFAYSVRQHTRDIGIRLALGAQSSQVMRSVLNLGARPLAAGLLAGACGALGAGQLLRTSLFGLSPFDPLSYLAVMAILTAAAVVAISVPAWRATRVDPLVALRSE